jgi:hypothetical protein
MCNSCSCSKGKTVSRQTYNTILQEFNSKKGLLYPIYANTIISDIFDAKDGSAVINNVLKLMQGHESCSNRVVGYFAALPDNTEQKFKVGMSFCVPSDYPVFNMDFARYLAMTKTLAGCGMLTKVNKERQVIFSDPFSPVYYFGYKNTIADQYDMFINKCIKYYHK